MKKLLVLISVALLSSCTSKEYSNFRGCGYRVVNNLFSSKTVITITGNSSPIDTYIIILDHIIDNQVTKGLKIKIADNKIKYLSKEDVLYIKDHANKMTKHDTMLSALAKIKPVEDRLSFND